MAALASIEELTVRIDRELDDRETAMAQAALADASELARFYGRNWLSAGQAPRLVRTLVLRAAKRLMSNPEGYVISRAGDETLGFSDKTGSENYGTVYFTKDEQALLAELGGRSGSLSTAGITAYGTRRNWECYTGHRRSGYDDEGRVPVDYAGRTFPLYCSDDGPW